MTEEKKELVEKGIKVGLGNRKFLEGVSEENLKEMVRAIEDRDGEIIMLKENKMTEVKDKNVTTVADLIREKRIKSRPVGEEAEAEEKAREKAKSDENKA